MRRALKVLIIAGDEPAALKLATALDQGGYAVTWQQVDRAEALSAELGNPLWQLVLSEYSLPNFDALAALALIKRARPELPVVVVADGLSEELAVGAMSAGARDCLARSQVARLLAVVERELGDAAARAAHGETRAGLQLADERLKLSVSSLAEGVSNDLQRPLSVASAKLDMALRELTALRPTLADPQARDRLADVFGPLNDAREASQRAFALVHDLKMITRAAPADPAHSPRRGKVLVIDDEPMVAYAVERTIARLHEVSVLTDARVALARIMAGERFDVLVCDLMMPELSGEDFYQALKSSVPQQAGRIMFLTGGAFTPQARAFLSQTPCRHLEKPFDAGVLTRALQEMMAAT